MTDIHKNTKLFKSRNIILRLLDDIGYNVKDYNVFSCNEIDAMNKTGQLDMLMSHTTNSSKVYVKFHLPEKQKQMSKNTLDDIIEDLYTPETLQKSDTLIIIIDEEPNNSNIQRINHLYNNDRIFITMFNIMNLQFYIKSHYLVPEMTIVKEEDIPSLMKLYQIKKLCQLPEISRYDAQAMCLLMRPNQVCKIVRGSISALRTTYYRVCV
jgi:DNA-directed RNA polymerase subunit H (RpoH/RPB5)